MAGCNQYALEEDLQPEVRVRRPLGAGVKVSVISLKERSPPAAPAVGHDRDISEGDELKPLRSIISRLL